MQQWRNFSPFETVEDDLLGQTNVCPLCTQQN